MLNPARAITKQFLQQSPLTLLSVGIVLSVLDFAVLYGAATKEGVLHVSQGVGLLENYGLLSTIVGNCICIYLAREYYESIHSITDSKAVTNRVPIERSL